MKETRRSPLDPNEHQPLSEALQIRLDTIAMVDKAVQEYANQSREIFHNMQQLHTEMQKEIRSMNSQLAELHQLQERVRAYEGLSNADSETLEALEESLDNMYTTVAQQSRLFTTAMKDLQLEWSFQQKKQAVIQDTLMNVRRLQAKQHNAVESYPDNLLYPDQQAKKN